MNAEDVKDRVRSTFGDSTGIQISDDDIIRWINDSVRDVAYNSDQVQAIATADITQGQYAYALPDDLLKAFSVKYDGGELQALSIQEADNFISKHDNADAQAKEARPTHYWIWARVINVWPTPSEDLTDGLVLYYIKQPVEIVTLDDDLDIPVQYHNIIVDMVLKKAYEKDEDWQAAAIKQNQSDTKLLAMQEEPNWDEHEEYPYITTAPRDSDGWARSPYGVY